MMIDNRNNQKIESKLIRSLEALVQKKYFGHQYDLYALNIIFC